MTTTTAELAGLTDDQLGELYCAAVWTDEDTAAYVAEAGRRDRAGRLARTRKLQELRWHDAAHAQYLEADAACRGRMFSAEGMRSGPADALGLWSAPERDAQRWASEELRNWWLGHPRLTFRQWQLQGSARADARRVRDERDLAAMDAEPSPAPHVAPVPDYRPRPVLDYRPRPTVAPMSPGAIARYTAALEYMARHTETVTARLVASQSRMARMAGGA